MKLAIPAEVAMSLAEILKHRTQHNATRNVNLPYYTRNYGSEMITILLAWKKNNYTDFYMSATDLQLKPRTLRNFFENSRKYLEANLSDYENLTAADREAVAKGLTMWTARQQGEGFWVRTGGQIDTNAGSMASHMVFGKTATSLTPVRSEFLMWINEGAEGEFDKLGLNLNEDDLLFFRDRQGELAGKFTALITKNRVKFKSVN